MKKYVLFLTLFILIPNLILSNEIIKSVTLKNKIYQNQKFKICVLGENENKILNIYRNNKLILNNKIDYVCFEKLVETKNGFDIQLSYGQGKTVFCTLKFIFLKGIFYLKKIETTRYIESKDGFIGDTKYKSLNISLKNFDLEKTLNYL